MVNNDYLGRENNDIMVRPFLMKPAAKDYLWGGSRLNDEFDKDIAMYPLAETWECSTHPDGLSIVASGEYEGMTLKDVLKLHPEYMGSHPLENIDGQEIELPILIKFIDANKDLSVQVHPDDEYAYKYENGQRGKTEMWYVLDATDNASIIYGLQFELSKEDIMKKINSGNLDKWLQKIPVEKDDVFLVEAGTIHAIGKGTLIAEIQENSNLTYRLYDYNRIDKNGSKRELHIDKALDVANLTPGLRPKQSMRVLRYVKGCATELLSSCKYFEVHRMLLNTERSRQYVDFAADDKSFRVLLCTSGCGNVAMPDGGYLNFFKGDCIFIPANTNGLKLHGKAQLLDVRC